MTVLLILVIVTAAASAALVCVELARDLMMMQQNSYFCHRYMRWLHTSADTTSMDRLCGLAVLFISLAPFASGWFGAGLALVFSLWLGTWLATRRYKKPLVWTPRARRIYAVALLLAAGVMTASTFIFKGPHPTALSVMRVLYITALALYCGSHMVTMAATWLLRPLESRIAHGFVTQARRCLEAMPDLKVVGITGSYGKTSTKHYLERILSEHFETLMTPGSYNTTMGVTRTVNEMLKPYTEVFVVEMGAKRVGDIAEICHIVRPTVGIVTAVGPQHLESFGSIENVQATKFELVDALPRQGGLAVVNQDFPQIASRKVDNVECLRYSADGAPGAQYTASDVKVSRQGTSFVLHGPAGLEMPLRTRLLGACNVSNLMAAVIVALRLGVPADKIRRAVEAIAPVEHRLSTRRTPGGITVIDDAFNSNPSGSRMALEVLGAMAPGQRIVITPGMIELGAEQHRLNADLGRHIAANADVAIIVGRYNREAILQGIADAGTMPEDAVHAVDTFADAQAVLSRLARPGDTVLYENDLPDTFK